MQITATGTDDITKAMGKLANFDEIATKHWKAAMRASVKPMAAAAKGGVPVFTGQFQRSIKSRVSGKGSKVTGRIGSYMDKWYPNVVEHGRGEGKKMPPPEALYDWLRAKGTAENELPQVAFVVARSIGKKGIKGVFAFKKAFESVRMLVMAQFTAANEAISRELAAK